MTNQPRVQILAVHPANCERSAVGIRSAWGAINRSLADMLGQTIASLDTASPPFSFGVQANLIRFGSIYAFQADFRIPDDNRVPVHNSGQTRDTVGSVCRPDDKDRE